MTIFVDELKFADMLSLQALGQVFEVKGRPDVCDIYVMEYLSGTNWTVVDNLRRMQWDLSMGMACCINMPGLQGNPIHVCVSTLNNAWFNDINDLKKHIHELADTL